MKRGFRTVSHGGSDTGFKCHLMLLPEKRLGVVVTTNPDGSPTSKLAMHVVDILLDNAPDSPAAGAQDASFEKQPHVVMQ